MLTDDTIDTGDPEWLEAITLAGVFGLATTKGGIVGDAARHLVSYYLARGARDGRARDLLAERAINIWSRGLAAAERRSGRPADRPRPRLR